MNWPKMDINFQRWLNFRRVARLCFICVNLWPNSSLLAQEAAPPTLDHGTPQPRDAEFNAAAPRSTTAAPSPEIPDIARLDEIFKQSSLGKDADDRRLHLEWRRLANQAANDPQVAAAKSAVELARTDLEKRQRLRAYYEIYYGRMRTLAATTELRAALNTLKEAHLAQTNQPRVRPATDGSMPTPPPVHKGKHSRY